MDYKIISNDEWNGKAVILLENEPTGIKMICSEIGFESIWYDIPTDQFDENEIIISVGYKFEKI